MSSLAFDLFNFWAYAFKRSPRITVAVTILTIGAATLTIHKIDKAEKERREAQRQQSLSYETQIGELNRMESSLRALTDFVHDQKTKLKESEDLVASLRDEQAKLRPVVEADRRAIQAVFDLQEERNRANIWRERWIGFAFGILASVLASFLYAAFIYIGNRFKGLPA